MLAIALVANSLLWGQQQVTIGSGVNWTDVTVRVSNLASESHFATSNYNSWPRVSATAWTHSGQLVLTRSLIRFNLSMIPPGSTIQSAMLKLNSDPVQNTCLETSNCVGSNSIFVSRVTAPWDSSTVTWNTQPPTDASNKIWFGPSTTITENIQIDVTQFVVGMLANPALNYGIMMQLETEATLRSRNYASENNTNASIRPSIVITYTPCNPPVAEAGNGGSECDLNFALNAVSSIGTGTWTNQSPGIGNAVFSNPNSPNASVTVGSSGTYIFRWTEVNACNSSFDDVTVNFYAQPNATITSAPGTACGLQQTLTSSLTSGLGGQWTMVNGPGSITFSNASSLSTTATASIFGTYLIRWTETNFICSDNEDALVTFVSQPPGTNFNIGKTQPKTIELTLAEFNSNYQYTVNWGDGINQSISSTQPVSHTYSLAGNYDVNLSTIVGGICPTITSQNIQIWDCLELETFDFTWQQQLCALKFTPTKLPNCTTNFEWLFGDEANQSLFTMERSPMHAYTTNGTYTVSLKVTLNCGGCQSSKTISKQITYTAPASNNLVEEVLLQVSSDSRVQVINSTVSTFSDSWPLPFEATEVENISGYWNATAGVWRNKASFVFNTPRSQSEAINTRIDGTYILNHFNWDYVDYQLIPGWIKANAITKYNAYGFEAENKDALGNYSSAVYDYAGQLPVANGVNMKNSEMAFTGFESLVDANGQFIPENRITGNWIFGGSNQTIPEYYTYSIRSAKKNVAIVEAKRSKFSNNMSVDVFPDRSPAILSNKIVCTLPHPESADLSLVVLNQAPNKTIWNGTLEVKNMINPPNPPVIDVATPHSGKYALKIVQPQTFKQEILKLDSGKVYTISAWVSVGNTSLPEPDLGSNLGIYLELLKKGTTTVLNFYTIEPSGPVIEGWQQVKGSFSCNNNNTLLTIAFKPGSFGAAWYDDLRLHPEGGNMKSYVYDATDFRLKAILDEENFGSFFYYDKEGNLYLTKKETIDGIKTLSENVSYMKTNE